MGRRKPCYGAMFPDTSLRNQPGTHSGSVFSYEVVTLGLAKTCKTTTDLAAWDKCLSCENFDHCYKLSMAKLNFQAATT